MKNHPQNINPHPVEGVSTSNSSVSKIRKLNDIGISLSAERDTLSLLERILEGAKELTQADGGTLYLVNEQQLRFEIIRTDSLEIKMGGPNGQPVDLESIPLVTENGEPNDRLVVAYCAHHRTTINIDDVYTTDGFDFSGTRRFDEQIGYRSVSFLTVPMQDHESEVIGVLQLINKQDSFGEVVPFNTEDQQFAESLASQAAVALTNKRLIDNLKELFESFIRLIAGAIDQKSPYTGKHCHRAPEIAMSLAKKASEVNYGPLKNFKLDAEQEYTLQVASWLHDCGKVTTPEYIVDKATKLETIYDRIGLIDTRFEVLKRDAEVHKLRQVVKILTCQDQNESTNQKLADIDQAYLTTLDRLEAEREFIRNTNVGGEDMRDADQHEVEKIARQTWTDPDGDVMPFLSTEEVYNLSIKKGTLNAEERDIINHHIVATTKMLKSLPFPKHLQNVTEYAVGHHERMDGKGYPLGLTREQMSVPARVMAIADIFEALTAGDRPYKDAKTLSQALSILGKMKLDHHIDPDLFDIFIKEKLYLAYSDTFLQGFQMDIREPNEIPGYPFDFTPRLAS